MMLGKQLNNLGRDLQKEIDDILFSQKPWIDSHRGVKKTVVNSTIIIKHFITQKLARKLCQSKGVDPCIYPNGTLIIEDQIDQIRDYLAKIGDEKLLAKSDIELKKSLLRELKKVNAGE